MAIQVAGITVQKVAHVVLKVRDLEKSGAFYRDVLGFKEVARFTHGLNMSFFSLGEQHHDLALREVGETPPAADKNAPGLYHVALKIGDDLDTLRAAKAHLERLGVPITAIRNHGVSYSIYLDDPDGNGIELLIDADPEIWRKDPTAVAQSHPFEL